MKVNIGQGVECLRCGHKWISRKPDIRSCAKCRSMYFDVPRKGEPKPEPVKKKLLKKIERKPLIKSGKKLLIKKPKRKLLTKRGN